MEVAQKGWFIVEDPSINGWWLGLSPHSPRCGAPQRPARQVLQEIQGPRPEGAAAHGTQGLATAGGDKTWDHKKNIGKWWKD